MTEESLTAILAERAMGWKAAPDRFIKSGRRWIPRWRFRPLADLANAFELLDQAAHRYTIVCDGNRSFTVSVQIGAHTGTASGCSKPRVITLAIAKALGVEVNR